MSRLCFVLVLLGLLAAPLRADELREFLDSPGGRGVPIVNPTSCPGGLRYDDGSYEGAVGFANANQDGAYVMPFDLPAGYRTDSICLCWTRTEFSTGDAVNFDVVFYAANGVGPMGQPGYPGTLLGFVPARAQNVPEFFTQGVAQYRVPIPPLPFGLPQRVYIGALWHPFVDRQFFLCNDATASTPLREAYSSTNGVEWSTTSNIRPTYRALGTVVFGVVPTATSVPLPWVGLGLAFALSVAGGWALRRRRRR